MPADPAAAALYHRRRFPTEIISHAVWLYFRFNLSHRDVEELLAERGIQVSYEAIRLWCRKFGPAYAEHLRRRRPRPADKWHVDEMQLKIRGQKYWLWRAVEQDGFVLDILVPERRNEQAAVAFLRRVLAAAGGEPRVIISDKLASDVPAVKRVLPTTEHRRHTRLNNRAENSHRPVHKRERVLQRFKSASTRSGSWSRLAPSVISSVRVATACLPTTTVRSCGTASAPGGKWSARRRAHERRLTVACLGFEAPSKSTPTFNLSTPERVLQRFTSAEHAQRFLGPFSAVSNQFRPRRHQLTASAYRQIRTHAHIARRSPAACATRAAAVQLG